MICFILREDRRSSFHHTPSHASQHELSVISAPTPISVSLTVPSSATGSTYYDAWDVLTTERSWVDSSQWIVYQTKHGLYEAKDLEFLAEEEVQELSELLATIPYKKFKKLMSDK